MRGTFTGFEGSVEAVAPDELAPPVFFSVGFPGLSEVAVCFGRFLVGLVDPEVAGFSFGLEVKNAPRTSSSWIVGAAMPMTTAHKQTNPKTITLTLITESPCCSPC
jgi:hypothetical protein